LGRLVAVKFVRESAQAISSASDHAKALTRVDNSHVVKVHALEEQVHPETRTPIPAIVMEYVPGPTLTSHLLGALDPNAAHVLIASLWNGLQAIHDAGIVHGDLDSDNVLVTHTGEAKIIDILHRGTFRFPPASDDVVRDLRHLAELVTRILRKTSVSDSLISLKMDPFLSSTTVSGESMCLEAYSLLTGQIEPQNALEAVYQAFRDAGFVDTNEYAEALDEEISDVNIQPFLVRITRDALIKEEHRKFLHRVWQRTSGDAQKVILEEVSKGLRGAIAEPSKYIQLIVYFDHSQWAALEKLPRLRVESEIIKAVETGRYDTHRPPGILSGHLGTWAAVLGSHFGAEGRTQLLTKINALLRSDWYTQNYVAVYFSGIFVR
jgi:RIO-like serine/threonine protein kinase